MPIKNTVKCALFAALMCICSWICLPLGIVTFTLQTFSMFLCLLYLGGKWGFVSLLAYLTLGAVGLPVFSGFQGGIGILLGPNGGFLWGFLLACLCYWVTCRLWKKKLLSCLLALGTVYLSGLGWYCLAYAPSAGIWQAFTLCVAPYILPDLLKIWLASLLARRLPK